jgi:hypothetical protein
MRRLHAVKDSALSSWQDDKPIRLISAQRPADRAAKQLTYIAGVSWSRFQAWSRMGACCKTTDQNHRTMGLTGCRPETVTKERIACCFRTKSKAHPDIFNVLLRVAGQPNALAEDNNGRRPFHNDHRHDDQWRGQQLRQHRLHQPREAGDDGDIKRLLHPRFPGSPRCAANFKGAGRKSSSCRWWTKFLLRLKRTS